VGGRELQGISGDVEFFFVGCSWTFKVYTFFRQLIFVSGYCNDWCRYIRCIYQKRILTAMIPGPKWWLFKIRRYWRYWRYYLLWLFDFTIRLSCHHIDANEHLFKHLNSSLQIQFEQPFNLGLPNLMLRHNFILLLNSSFYTVNNRLLRHLPIHGTGMLSI